MPFKSKSNQLKLFGTASDRQDKDNKLSKLSIKNENLVSPKFEDAFNVFKSALQRFVKVNNPLLCQVQVSTLETSLKLVHKAIKKGGNNE